MQKPQRHEPSCHPIYVPCWPKDATKRKKTQVRGDGKISVDLRKEAHVNMLLQVKIAREHDVNLYVHVLLYTVDIVKIYSQQSIVSFIKILHFDVIPLASFLHRDPKRFRHDIVLGWARSPCKLHELPDQQYNACFQAEMDPWIQKYPRFVPKNPGLRRSP